MDTALHEAAKTDTGSRHFAAYFNQTVRESILMHNIVCCWTEKASNESIMLFRMTLFVYGRRNCSSLRHITELSPLVRCVANLLRNYALVLSGDNTSPFKQIVVNCKKVPYHVEISFVFSILGAL